MLFDGNSDLAELIKLARTGDVSLVFAARDREHNPAIVLREWLANHLEQRVE